MQRVRLIDCRTSRLSTVLGLCQSDILGIASYVNSAQRRLIYAKEAGDEGWFGSWAEMAFTVSVPPTTASPNLPGPYLTTPREVARLEGVNLCERPVPIQNQFFEYLEYGNGRMPKTFRRICTNWIPNVFSRNVVPTFKDLGPGNQVIMVTPASGTDVGKRVLIQGTDSNGKVVYSQDGLNRVQGIFVVLQLPFVSTPFQFASITGIQKDPTNDTVDISQADPTTGNTVLLLTMQPSELTAGYRRYFFDNLPASCCFTAAGPNVTVQPAPLNVTAIVKLDLIPVVVDTDYCLIQNLEAIICECESIRYSEVDNPNANIAMSKNKHLEAIRLLNGELAHFLGIDEPAVNFSPFGHARLENQRIGLML